MFFLTLVAVGSYQAAADHRLAQGAVRDLSARLALTLDQHATGVFQSLRMAAGRVQDGAARQGLEPLVKSGEGQRLLDATARALPQPGQIWLFDADGWPLLMSGGKAPPAVYVADRPYFQAHKAGAREHFGQLIESRYDGRPIYTYSQRINAPNGRFAGVVLTTVYADGFLKFFDSLGLPQGSILSIWLESGPLVVKSPPDQRDFGLDLTMGSGLQRLGDRREMTYESRSFFRGEVTRTRTIRRLDGLPILVVASPADTEIISAWRERLLLHGLVLVLMGLLMLAPLLMAGRSVRGLAETKRALETALMDKEVLFREVHHRVKNNLQVVSSLLAMQALKTDDEASRAALEEMIQRVESMALVHTTLYQSNEAAQVDMARYVPQLCASLAETHGADARGIRLSCSVTSVALNIDQAVPLGLLLTELVTNALKHAYPQGGGEVRVSLSRQDGGVSVQVSDDGIGLAGTAGPRRRPGSIGMTLVQALANQLEAQLDYTEGPGTLARISFAA